MSRLQQDGLSVSSEMAQTADEFTQRVRANHYDIIAGDQQIGGAHERGQSGLSGTVAVVKQVLAERLIGGDYR